MENSIKCPVCGKEGIPDFHKEKVVCPCCNADLSVYHNIYAAITKDDEKGEKSPRRNRSVVIAACVAVVCIAALCCQLVAGLHTRHEHDAVVADMLRTIDSLNVQAACLSARLENAEDSENIEGEVFFFYVVQQGDSFRRISRHLYGTEERYKEIMTLNQQTESHILHPGDTIKISVR